jgi:transposase
MLVELRVAEQRLRAVWEVLDGASVTEVARRFKVSRQSVHVWLRRHAAHQGLGDRSSRPHGCPHQMSPVVEARVVEIRRAHPAWGTDRIGYQLERVGVWPVPGRTSISRAAGAERAGRAGAAAPSSGGVSAVGTGPADGVVAGRCGRRLPPGRWD